MKIKKYTMFAVLAIGFLFGANAPETNAQISILPGSYQKSCQDMKIEGSALAANLTRALFREKRKS